VAGVAPVGRARPVPAPRGLAHARTLQRAGDDLHAAVAELHAELGPAFAFGFGPIRFAWFVGAGAARAILHERRDAFSQRGGYDFLKVVGGPTALISSDEPEHLRRRRRVQPAFHGRHTASWLASGEAVLGPWLEALAASGEAVDLYRGLRPRLVRIVARIALGDVPLASDPAWLRDVSALMDFPGRPMLEQQWKIPLPGTPWGRFVAARRRVDRALYGEIARRRAAGAADGGAGDVLGMLLGPDGEGDGLSDAELRDQTLSLISAGFDTTAAALTWCLAMAAEHEEAGARLRAALADGDPVAAQREPYVDAFVKETLRLRPPAAAALRRTVREVEVAGYRLARGQRVALSILLTHRDPEVFPDPERFDPDRFAACEPPPFGYVPFGYGVRHCIGAGTATALVKAGLALTLGRFRTRPLRPGPYRPVGMTLHPEGGFPATVAAGD
jgi:hypothetical protein